MTAAHDAAPPAIDPIQQQLADYARSLRQQGLPRAIAHAASALIIDTLGVLVAAYPFDPCRLTRRLAEQTPMPAGATIVGSELRTSPQLAAFVNATTARYAEANDVYARHRPGRMHGHPSDVIFPLFAAAEARHTSGRDFLAAVVLAYEIYLWLCDSSVSGGFDPSTFGTLAVAMGAAQLLGLDDAAMRHCIAMAVVPNNMLKQVRADQLSPWKAVAAGQAGRAGIFAAELAQIGLPGPNLPFVGTSGWCDHVAASRLEAEALTPACFRILGVRMKPRPARALTIPAIQAAERIALPASRVNDISAIDVQVHRQAAHGTHAEHWQPDSRETADHSIPYVVAVALLDGKVTVRSFDAARLEDPKLRMLMSKMTLSEDEQFSAAFAADPQQYCARVTVTLQNGTRLAAQSGGDAEDLAAPKSDGWVNSKFRDMTDTHIDSSRADAILERLWRIDEVADVATLPQDWVVTQ